MTRRRSDPDRPKWSTPASTDAPTSDCLDDDTLGALAEGTLGEATRSAALPHLAECARCRSAVASLARAFADPDLAREIEAVTTRSERWRWLAWSGAAAAAVLLVVIVAPPASRNPQSAHRAPVIANAPAPTSLTPAGEVAGVKELRWTQVEAADRYRVTLFNPDGRVLFETMSEEAFVILPDSVVLGPGIRYLWKVEARVGFGRWVSSNLVSFTLVGSVRP